MLHPPGGPGAWCPAAYGHWLEEHVLCGMVAAEWRCLENTRPALGKQEGEGLLFRAES